MLLIYVVVNFYLIVIYIVLFLQTILEAILPCYVQQIQLPTYNKEGKTEKEIINQLAIAVRTLVNNSEALTKYELNSSHLFLLLVRLFSNAI